MIDPYDFLSRIRRGIDEKIERQAEILMNEHAPDYPTYCVAYGCLQGLRTAKLEIDELIKAINSGRGIDER